MVKMNKAVNLILFLAAAFLFLPFFCYANELIGQEDIMIPESKYDVINNEILTEPVKSDIPLIEQKQIPVILYEYTKYEEAPADTYEGFNENIDKRTEQYQIFDTNEADVKLMVMPPISDYVKDTETGTWLKTYKTTNFDEVFGATDKILKHFIKTTYALDETINSFTCGRFQGSTCVVGATEEMYLSGSAYETCFKGIVEFDVPDLGTYTQNSLEFHATSWDSSSGHTIKAYTETYDTGGSCDCSAMTGDTEVGSWVIANNTSDEVDLSNLETESNQTYQLVFINQSSGNDYSAYHCSGAHIVLNYTEGGGETSSTTQERITGDWTDELTVITGYTEHYDTSTTTPDWTEKHYYHIPFIVWIIITTISLFIMDRIIIEFLIRWRR